MDLPEHALENRALWDAMADDWVASGERSWAADEPTWGNWQLPDAEVGLLPDDLSGQRCIELGCGTGYVSAWMAGRGAASILGVDVSARQLATARRLADEHGIDIIEFREQSAEAIDAPDASFDFAVSEYGAAIWCDPYVWIPEAARLLRPGGRLHFLGTHPLLCSTYAADGGPADVTLVRDWRGMHALDWRHVAIDPGGVEFNLTPSVWMALFADHGFVVEEYLELYAPPEADGERYSLPAWWAKRFPCEQVWKVRRLG